MVAKKLDQRGEGMTLEELYQIIDGDYEKAMRVLRVEKLLDKHIRKLPKNGVVDNVIAAGKDLDPTTMFETTHAMKGVCLNLGLNKLAEAASELSEEFRPGTDRELDDLANNVRVWWNDYKKTL